MLGITIITNTIEGGVGVIQLWGLQRNLRRYLFCLSHCLAASRTTLLSCLNIFLIKVTYINVLPYESNQTRSCAKFTGL